MQERTVQSVKQRERSREEDYGRSSPFLVELRRNGKTVRTLQDNGCRVKIEKVVTRFLFCRSETGAETAHRD